MSIPDEVWRFATKITDDPRAQGVSSLRHGLCALREIEGVGTTGQGGSHAPVAEKEMWPLNCSTGGCQQLRVQALVSHRRAGPFLLAAIGQHLPLGF